MKPQIIVIDEPLKGFIVETEATTSGYLHLILRFPNDYGASVITGAGAYGLEMARILFVDEEAVEYNICEEPFGWLTNEQLNKMLHNIKETGWAKEDDKE